MRPVELLFVKETVDGGHPASALTSSLTTQIQRAQAPTPPIYRRQQGSPRQVVAPSGGAKLKLSVHLPVDDLVIQMEVRSSISSEAVIRVVLDIYRREHATRLHPVMLDGVRHYQLFIAEEGGRADEDFPGLDPHAVLGTTGALHFALQHLEGGLARGSPTPSGPPRGSVSFSGSGSEERKEGGDEGGEGGRGKGGDGGEHGVSRMEGQRSPQAFNLESSQSQERLMQPTPWYARVLCCGRGAMGEEMGDAPERRPSRGTSAGGLAVPEVAGR